MYNIYIEYWQGLPVCREPGQKEAEVWPVRMEDWNCKG